MSWETVSAIARLLFTLAVVLQGVTLVRLEKRVKDLERRR